MNENNTKETIQMSKKTNDVAKSGDRFKYVIVTALVLGAFFGAYRYAQAKTAAPTPIPLAAAPIAAAGGAATTGSTGSGNGFSSACACCGSTQPTKNGVTGAEAEGQATVEGGVQRISIDVSKGYYQPNTIVLKAGVPAEITFGQGSGCTGQVQSSELGFSADISAGPQTVKLPALEKGEYPFYCGMRMVFGRVVVE